MVAYSGGTLTGAFGTNAARWVAAEREAGEDHPFVAGADSVQRYFSVMTECATAAKLRAGAK